jgi:uncharacterized RDD family membrane protein YckC
VSATERPTAGPEAGPHAAGPTTRYAGIVTRGVAIVIDGAALALAFSILTASIGLALSLFVEVDPGATATVIGALGGWAVIVSIYFTICWSSAGQTLGMRLMGIRVERITGEGLGVLRAFLRFLALSAQIGPLFVGLLLVLVHPRRRAAHDLLARTVVVYTDAPDA